MPKFIPDGLGVRIPDSHSGGPGSIPGQGAFFFENQPLNKKTFILKRASSLRLRFETHHLISLKRAVCLTAQAGKHI